MPSTDPRWVIDDLAKLLGLDDETVRTQLLPDLEGYTSETRLRSHLQDLLGPSAHARSYIQRYANLRFPSIQPTPSRPQPSLKDADPPFPGQVYRKNRDADNLKGWSGRREPTRHPQLPMRSGGTINEKPRSPYSDDHSASGKGKQKEKIWDAPMSKEMKRLQQIRENLAALQRGNAVGNDHPECFCRARVHPLSEYTPHCGHCGLVLCELHPAHSPCPSCRLAILNPSQIARLLQRVQADMEEQLAHEQGEREEAERGRLARLAAESGGGSFPVLSQRPDSLGPDVLVPSQARKVLTIGKSSSGRAQVTSTTYTRTTSSASRPTTPPPSDIVHRPRSPLIDRVRGEKELDKVLRWRSEEDRPWGDLTGEKKGDLWAYVPDEIPVFIEDGTSGRRREAKKRGEARMGKGGRVIPGVTA